MNKIDEGGPAFPHTRDFRENHGGMSLRDWFAGQAMNAELGFDMVWGLVRIHELMEGAEPRLGDDVTRYRRVAERAYGFADAMLAARKP